MIMNITQLTKTAEFLGRDWLDGENKIGIDLLEYIGERTEFYFVRSNWPMERAWELAYYRASAKRDGTDPLAAAASRAVVLSAAV